MPEVQEAVAITALYGKPRVGMHRHEFVGGNFFMQRILNAHRDDLGVAALPSELSVAADRAVNFLQTQSARVSIRNLQTTASGLSVDVLVENLTGHKLPTAYPSRRAWLHVVLRDRNGRLVFESGALNPDGSIAGNERLRELPVLGATAVIRYAKPDRPHTSPWLLNLLARKPRKLAAVALANKMVRIVWAMLRSGEAYRPRPATA